MKNFSLVLILIAAIVFFGCQKDTQISSDEGVQSISQLKADKIPFTGICTFVDILACGSQHEMGNGMVKITGFQSIWYDNTSDPLTTGHTYWHEDFLIAKDGKSTKVWGKATLVLDDEKGEWEFSMQGSVDVKEGEEGVIEPACPVNIGPPASTIIGVCKATGKSGMVKGMVGEWTYTLDTDTGFYYKVDGWYR
jgi:hypothetical protein